MTKEAVVDLEMVDIIDEDFNILYQMLKTEAHEKGELHGTVIAGLKNTQGKRALVRQADHMQDRGQFVNPMGGHISAGESWEGTLFREALEELGIEGFEYKLLGKGIYNRQTRGKQENHYFIVYDILHDGDITLGNESVELRWFDEDELRAEIKNSPDNFGAAYHFVLNNFYPELLS